MQRATLGHARVYATRKFRPRASLCYAQVEAMREFMLRSSLGQARVYATRKFRPRASLCYAQV
jgi:hypothetical protein